MIALLAGAEAEGPFCARLDRTTQMALFLMERWSGAFRVATGRSAHRVLHRDNKAQLRYFAAARAESGVGSGGPAVPVFISMPLINTWTIFDLLPGRSVIERLTSAGYPVYLVDWGRPGPEDSGTPLCRYVDTTLGRMAVRALRHARGAAEAAGLPSPTQLDALGYCVGGTFLTMHIARQSGSTNLNTHRRPAAFRRLCTLATPIDFHRSGRLADWSKPAHFPLDALVDGLGNYPKEMMRASFRMLRPTGDMAKWQGLWSRIDDADFRTVWAALEDWNADGVNFPGEAYREYVRGCYFENALMTGGWTMDGSPVDLGEASIPAHAIAASADHIVPPPAAFGLADVWGGAVTTQTVRGGHVGVCVGKELPDALIAWLRTPVPATTVCQ